MNFLLFPFGSAGDVHPFIPIARGLQSSGHQVKFFTNGHFRRVAEANGLDFVELGTEEDFLSVLKDPDLWHPQKGFRVVVQHGIIPSMRRIYNIILEHNIPGETVVLAASMVLGARIAQEKHGIPTVIVHLQPAVFRSAYRPPVLQGLFLRTWQPRWHKRFMYRLADVLIDSLLKKEVNAFRAELGLPPVRRILNEWWHSPDLVLGLFPDWFGDPQPDWPPQTRLTGFPLYDATGFEDAPAELEQFLSAGDAPVVFTPGSAMRHAKEFFADSVSACQHIGTRGLLLTRDPEQVPGRLPDSIRHFTYVPFSQVLPRAAALVHHGGIGTTAQALAAGIPQLIVPFSHDQPDNAARIKRLGVGSWISPRSYSASRAAKALKQILGSSEMERQCKSIAQQFVGHDAVAETCAVIEEFAQRNCRPFPSRTPLATEQNPAPV